MEPPPGSRTPLPPARAGGKDRLWGTLTGRVDTVGCTVLELIGRTFDHGWLLKMLHRGSIGSTHEPGHRGKSTPEKKPVENASQSSAPKRQSDLHAGRCH